MNISFLGWAAGCGLLMVVGTQTFAAGPNDSSSATVVRLHGKARYSTDNKSWQPVKKNTVLHDGAILQTADNSTLDIRLGSERGSGSGEHAEGIVRLQADTVLAIEHLKAPSDPGAPQDVEFDLQAGEIAGSVGQLPAGSHYEVKFAKGIAGVRGGVYHISASGDVAVPSGETVVVIMNNEGTPNSTVITSGKRFDAMSGSITDLPPGSSNEKSFAPPSSPNPKNPGLGGSLRNF